MSKIKVWAHRGLSMDYPENTISAFLAAAKVPGLTGIETDVHLSKDGEIVVIHNETVDCMTNGTGRVCDFTLEELKKLDITGHDSAEIYHKPDGTTEKIPTLAETFDTLMPYFKQGLLLNIELKNSKEPYPGLEEKLVSLVSVKKLWGNVIFSSFNPASMKKIKKLNRHASTGILGKSITACYKLKRKNRADALHPSIDGLCLDKHFVKKIMRKRIPVRMWNTYEPFFGQDKKLKMVRLAEYEICGITDIITNVADKYLA